MNGNNKIYCEELHVKIPKETKNYNISISENSFDFEHKVLGEDDSVEVILDGNTIVDFEGAMMVDPEIEEFLNSIGIDTSYL